MDRKKIKQMTREYYLDKYSKQIEIIATIIIGTLLFPLFYIFMLACFAVPAAFVQ